MTFQKEGRPECVNPKTGKTDSDTEQGRVVLVTGGCRSGKSEFAESLLSKAGAPLFYIATAQIHDSGMEQRVKAHQKRRGRGWLTVEESQEPDRIFRELAVSEMEISGILLDCITLWLSNCMMHDASDTEILRQAGRIGESARMASAVKKCPVVLVTNEVGSGVSPTTELGNRFRDMAGLINQNLARMADDVVLVACGLPVCLKGNCVVQ